MLQNEIFPAMDEPDSHRQSALAVLIGAPHEGQIAIHNDVVAMYDALRLRQLPPEDILSLEGNLTRKLVLNFLTSVRDEIVERQAEEIFLYWTGHGFFTGGTAETARVGVALQASGQEIPEHHVFWDELFEVLSIPANIKVGFLPDH